ncbi:type II secretion system F family protein [Novosphingobium rosa]|uniref:type II secretion system F family protein n=1 Tax=Novosphingobium rosa TaxID=76978 RepID=UPI00082A855F|nr:type II secretion system F family protein [Novosphingobium rosa]
MMPDMLRLAAMVAVFVSVFVAVRIAAMMAVHGRAQRQAVNRRLGLLRQGLDRETVVGILRGNRPGSSPAIPGPLGRMLWRLHRMVAMANLRVAPQNLLVMCAGAALALDSGVLFLVWSARIRVTAGVVELVSVVAVAVAVVLPLMVISRMAQKRRKQMEQQFPLALDVFTRALKAGHPIAAAIDLLTREVADPLGSEFGLVADEVTYGAELNDALMRLADRWDLDDIRMFVVSLSVQNETGGNLAEVLENLLRVIRERAALYMKVRALSSEGRMSGWMLTVLPVLTLASMFAVNPRFYLDVAQDSIFTWGFSILMAMYALGVFIISRIVDIKV